MSRMLGSDAVLRSLEAEGVDVAFGIPGGAILPIYDAIARGTTRPARARPARAGRGSHGRGLRARVRPHGRRVRDLGPGGDQPRHADRRRVDGLHAARLHHRPGPQPPDRHRRLPGVRHHRRDDADRQALVARPGRRRRSRTSSRPPSTSPAPAAAALCSSTSRATSRRRRSTSTTRSTSTSPAGGRRPAATRARSPRPPRRIAAAEKPVLYVGGGTLNADACAELLDLAEGGRLPVVTTLMAKSAFPETHELHFGWPGMHGPKWSNLAMNTCDVLVSVGARFDDRVTGKLDAFAPGRDGRSTSTSTRPRSTSSAARTSRSSGRSSRSSPTSPPRSAACARSGGTADTEPWLRRIEEWRRRVPAPLRNGRAAQAAEGARDAAGADRRPRRRDLDDRRRPAPDVGDAVPALRPAAHASSPRAGSGRWATASRPRSGRRRRGPTRPSSASTATAASR